MVLLRILILAFACAVVATCGGASSPGGIGTSYAGAWTGTTAQGARIELTVSPQNTVTSIVVGAEFNGCRETFTFTGLTLPIGDAGGLGRVPPASGPSFGFGSGPPEAPNFVQVTGQFTSSRSAQGTVTFLNFETCGNTVTFWTATRR